MVEKMQARPWPVYKIKVGSNNDIEVLTALRKHTNAPFYVDANGAWTASEALVKIPQLKEFGVELVEQPLAKDDWEGMKVLYESSPLPLFADESCVFENDVEKCFNTTGNPCFLSSSVSLTFPLIANVAPITLTPNGVGCTAY